MMDAYVQPDEDRLTIVLDAAGPIDLTIFSESLAALARLYKRANTRGGAAPGLFVTRLDSGSLIVEVAILSMLGQTIVVTGGIVTLADFAARISKAIKAFAGMDASLQEPPSQAEARDFRDFIKPLTGKQNATLRVTHARYVSRTAEREVVAEYSFGQDELSNASKQLGNTLITSEGSPLASERRAGDNSSLHYEGVALHIDQISRGRGKGLRKTRVRAVVPEITSKSLPTAFAKHLMDRVIGGKANPFALTFIVDVEAQLVAGEPSAYLVLAIYDASEKTD